MPTTMLRKVLPRRLKASIREAIRREVETHLTLIPQDAGIDVETIRRERGNGPASTEAMSRRCGRISPDRGGYMIPKTPEKTPEKCLHHESSLATDPAQGPLAGLRRDGRGVPRPAVRSTPGPCGEMPRGRPGPPSSSAGRILEFGCADRGGCFAGFTM